jgi:hypothetical protein
MVNPDPLGRLPSDKRAQHLDLPIPGRLLASIRGALPHVAGSAAA